MYEIRPRVLSLWNSVPHKSAVTAACPSRSEALWFLDCATSEHVVTRAQSGYAVLAYVLMQSEGVSGARKWVANLITCDNVDQLLHAYVKSKLVNTRTWSYAAVANQKSAEKRCLSLQNVVNDPNTPMDEPLWAFIGSYAPPEHRYQVILLDTKAQHARYVVNREEHKSEPYLKSEPYPCIVLWPDHSSQAAENFRLVGHHARVHTQPPYIRYVFDTERLPWALWGVKPPPS